MTIQMITCSGCDATWTGLGRAHCSKCHRSFSTVPLFDMHRDQRGEHGRCIDPEDVRDSYGYRRLFFRHGMWCGPEMTEEQRARLVGVR